MGDIKRALLLLISVLLVTCVKMPKSNNENDTADYFDFATIGNYSLTINYNLKFESPIEFYVYDEFPLKDAEDEFEEDTFKEDLSPILKGITDISGKFSGVITIKKAVQQLYFYSPTIGVPQLLKSTLVNNAFSVEANNPLNYIESAISNPLIYTKGAIVFSQNAIIAEGYHSLGSWNSSGVPSYLISPSAVLPAALINDLNTSLPENKRVPDLNPHFIVNDETKSLNIVSNAKVEMVFVHEGASMRNVMGYFHFPTGNPPKSASEITKIIAFPNVSYSGSGGNLSTGNRVQLKYWDGNNYLETFPAGVSIGWFIIAYGFNNEAKILTKNPHYYSFSAFNPESEANLKAHCVLVYDAARKVYIIGFEDQLRTRSDNDFNDALFYVSVTPENAVLSNSFPLLKKSSDSDGDGIPDYMDEFPNDPKIVYTNYYPSFNGYNTLAFEDMWPTRGDYDMNDVVLSYNSTHYLNNKNQVVKVLDKIRPKWSGGILDVGFGYQLGVSSSVVKSVGRASDFKDPSFKYSLSANGTEPQQSKATILVFDNVTELGLNGSVKPFFNLEITFNSPVSLSELTTPPYNPFIIINKNRGMEVHMPNYRPTDRADFKLFGTYNDKSNPGQNRFYVSDAEMPWGILIPGEFKFPAERLSVVNYYPNFLPWAKSFGAEFPDWYLSTK